MKWILFAVALAACSDGGGKKVDAAISDGQPLTFTGEYVDWSTTDDASFFCGIFQATFTVHGDATRTNQTNPNGRFTLSLVPAETTQIDITPPTAQSECSQPKSTYSVPGIMIANASVIASGQMVSARAFTVAQMPAGYDGTKAQVFVHVDGTPRAVSITGTHDATQAFNGTTFVAGDTGDNVYFPNLDPTGGTTTISTTGTALGTGTVPVAAGTFTYVTLVMQ